MPDTQSDALKFVPDLDVCEVGVKITAAAFISLLKHSGLTVTDVIAREISATILFEQGFRTGSLCISPTHISLEVIVNDYDACVIGKSEFTFTGDAADDDVLIINHIRGMFSISNSYSGK